MKLKEPSIFCLVGSALIDGGSEMQAYLEHIGAGDWTTDALSDSETMIEVAGRRCYKSFGTELNPNITRVREGNAVYINGILSTQHGSVLEHVSITYGIEDVSRIFTHELVRHRHASPSQESMRFVRLDQLEAYWPDAFDTLPEEKRTEVEKIFRSTFERAEADQVILATLLDMDNSDMPFAAKKKLQSAMRRMIPDGILTGIILTANHRTWRDSIEKRTSRHAEEEIRKVFSMIAMDLEERFPAIYQDMVIEDVDGIAECTFKHGTS